MKHFVNLVEIGIHLDSSLAWPRAQIRKASLNENRRESAKMSQIDDANVMKDAVRSCVLR